MSKQPHLCVFEREQIHIQNSDTSYIMNPDSDSLLQAVNILPWTSGITDRTIGHTSSSLPALQPLLSVFVNAQQMHL